MRSVNDDGLLELLAALEHERWSGWERYREEVCDSVHPSGELNEERWRRQRETPYAELTEKEKESDRIEARKGLKIIQAWLDDEPQR